MAKATGSKSVNTEQGAALLKQLQQRFVGLWQRLTSPSLEEEGAAELDSSYVADYLANLKERAYLERTIANQYRGRYLLELIQNAVDAMHKHSRTRRTSAEPPRYRCYIEVTKSALFVANDGQSFEEADVRGVCAMGQSTKPAGEYIGYKGLGFRAVLEISDRPEIYSGPYQFGFSRAETLALLTTPGAPANLDKAEIPILSVPHLRSPEELPATDREILAKLKKAGYATVIRLPFKSPSLYRTALDNCRQLLSDPTLLFLPYITELNMALPGDRESEPGTLVTIVKTSRELAIRPESLSQQVQVSRLNFRRTETQSGARKTATPTETLQDWLLVTPRQPIPIEPPELVTRLEDTTWAQMKQASLALAFPLARMPWGGGDFFLKRRPDPLPFFAHFPTQEGSGLGFAVHADFYLSASRKQIEWEVGYNRWLAEKVVSFLVGPALQAVHYLYPDEATLIEILLDYSYFNDYFGREFREMLDNRLTRTAFIPVGNGNYMPPDRVVWTPLEQDGVLIFRRVFRYPGADLFYPVLQLEEVYTKNTPSTEEKEKAVANEKKPAEDFGFYDLDDLPARNYDTATSDSSNYDYDPYSREYDYDPYRPEYEEEKSPAKAEAEAEFDYDRIRRFLSNLGVRKLAPSQLPQIFGQALTAWEIGQILTSEICAALALWYAELIRNNAADARQLLELAQGLPVIPTIPAGWQVPEDRRYVFVDEAPLRSLEPGSADIIPAVPEESRQELLLVPLEAYDLPEFRLQVKNWHRALGVRTVSP